MTRVALSFLALVVLAGCAPKPQTVRLDANYKRLLRVCEQIYLPNSMALAEGVDKEKRQLDLERERLVILDGFRDRTGEEYLETQLRASTDDLDRACLKFSLAEVRGQSHPPGEE